MIWLNFDQDDKIIFTIIVSLSIKCDQNWQNVFLMYGEHLIVYNFFCQKRKFCKNVSTFFSFKSRNITLWSKGQRINEDGRKNNLNGFSIYSLTLRI